MIALVSLKNHQPEMLVIGYGNSLRGDDCLGIVAANEISNWNLAGVQCLCLHQLTPELAPILAKVTFALFLDAQSNHVGDSSRIQALSLDLCQSQGFSGHRLEPATLLQLAKQAYGESPQSWLITIPGFEFELGEKISSEGQKSLKNAMVLAKELLVEKGYFVSSQEEILYA